MKKKILTVILSLAMVVSVSFGFAGIFKPDTAIAARGDKLSGKWISTSTTDITVDAQAGDFSIIAMGDQQIALGNEKYVVEESYKYIAKNKDAMNLKMYINLGDVLDVADFCSFIGGYNSNDANGRNRGEDNNAKYFWQQQQIVSEWVQILEDAEVPVAMLMGNHDYEDMATLYRIGKTFNEAFPLSRFTPYQVEAGASVDSLDGTHYFGGSMYDDIENSYYYFNGNGQKYMVLVLGLHPSQAMIDWANQLVEANSDCKVIVATHAYFKGGTSTYDSSERLWNNLLSKHENIIMSMCGHSSDSGNIVRKVNFGDNGNPVYQFMINSQDQEFGGMGVFAQIIFRANGNIDFAYYSPAVDTYGTQLGKTETQGRYYGEINQFTLDGNLEEIEIPTTGEVFVGNSYAGEDIYENYAAYNSANAKWLRNVYAYNNVSILNAKGLVTNGIGYVTYKLNAGEYNRFRTMYLMYLGKVASTGKVSIDISFDGVNFENALYNDSTINVLGREVDINRYVLGAKDLYVRLILQGDNNTYISTLDMDGKTIQTIYGTGSDSMNHYLDFSDTATINSDNAEDFFFDSFDAMTRKDSGVLGAGDLRDNFGSKSSLTFRFESGEGRAFKGLDFSAVMRIREFYDTYTFATRNVDYNGSQFTIEGATYGIKEADHDYVLRVFVSIDGGKNYTKVKEYLRNDNIGENVSVNADLSSYVANATEVYVKLDYLGFNWDYVGFKSINFDGEFNGALSGSAEYQLNGGTIYSNNVDNPVKDGYKFDGWYLGSLSGQKVNASDYANLQVTLCAKWLKLSRVTYILDGGENNSDNKNVLVEGETLNLANPTKDGYRFIGWYNAECERVTSVTSDGSNIVVYAIWYQNN